MKRMKMKPLARDLLGVELRKVSENDQTRLVFSASSEREVERWFGTEILEHSKDAIRLERAELGAMPLLFNHNMNRPIGMIDRAVVRDRKIEVEAHLFDTEEARNVEKMIDGGLRNVSIGYEIHAFEEEKKSQRYTATDWEPFEVSIVTVPADPSVGLGRGIRGAEYEVDVVENDDGSEVQGPIVFQRAAAEAAKGSQVKKDGIPGASAGNQEEGGDVAIATASTGLDAESARKKAIRNLCKATNLDERFAVNFITRGLSIDQAIAEAEAVVLERSKDATAASGFVGMEKKEVERYSLMRAMRAAMSRDWSKAGLELSAHKAVMAAAERQPRGEAAFFVPADVLMADLAARSAHAASTVAAIIAASGRRDMTAAGVSGSQFLIGTENRAGSFIDLLRNTSVLLAMNATRLSGLRGNITIPRKTAAATAYWLADENTQITESQPTIGQLSLTPKNVAALTEISHQLMLQSDPSVDALVMNELAQTLALAVDVAGLRGSGSTGQPQGIVGTSGVGAFTGTSLAAAGVLDAQQDVAAANALMDGVGYVTTPGVAALLMQRPELPTTGTTRLWQGNMLRGSMFGFPAMSSNQMASATMLFGHWPSVIVAEWGVLELMMNPYSDFTRGLSSVRAWYTVDIGVRYPAAFSYASSIT